MATINRFEEIESWRSARELCKTIGDIIDSGKLNKNYRLTNQIEGSSGSIMDNIAEGFERGTRAEFIQFLGYSKGSSGEFRSQLYRAKDRNYITDEEFELLYNTSTKISAQLQKFIAYLQQTSIKGTRAKNQQG